MSSDITPACHGDGSCLQQSFSPNDYIYSFPCVHNCKPLPCYNSFVCNRICPLWCLNIHGGTCINCAVSFGKLYFNGTNECPVCLDNKDLIKLPNCSHAMCSDCFKRCYMYSDDINEPPFPYPDIEEEYFDNQDDPQWNQYPLIQRYHIDYDIWKSNVYHQRQQLSRCPICRI